MNDKTVQIKEIMSRSTLPVLVLKSFGIKIFIMGYHAYKSIWTPAKDEQLHAAMQPTNALNKYAAAVKRKESQVVSHLLLGNSGKFEKQQQCFTVSCLIFTLTRVIGTE